MNESRQTRSTDEPGIRMVEDDSGVPSVSTAHMTVGQSSQTTGQPCNNCRPTTNRVHAGRCETPVNDSAWCAHMNVNDKRLRTKPRFHSSDPLPPFACVTASDATYWSCASPDVHNSKMTKSKESSSPWTVTLAEQDGGHQGYGAEQFSQRKIPPIRTRDSQPSSLWPQRSGAIPLGRAECSSAGLPTGAA